MTSFERTVQTESDRITLTFFTDRAAFTTQQLKRKGKNGRMSKIKAAYFGFDSYADAKRFASTLRKYAVVREAKRLIDWVYEVVVTVESEAEVRAIAATLDRFYPTEQEQQAKQIKRVAIKAYQYPLQARTNLEQRRRRALFC